MRNVSKTLIPFLVLTLSLTLLSASALAFPGSGGGGGKAPADGGAAAPAQAPRTTLQGNVVETMNSGGYTYLLVENEGQKQWAAVPGTEVKVGQEVQLSPGMTMKNFTSKTLGRTFGAILFSQGIISAN